MKATAKVRGLNFRRRAPNAAQHEAQFKTMPTSKHSSAKCAKKSPLESRSGKLVIERGSAESTGKSTKRIVVNKVQTVRLKVLKKQIDAQMRHELKQI